MTRKYFLLIFILFFSKNIFALDLEETIAINKDRGNGARIQGMGRAFTAIADDANAIFFNPAGVLQIKGQLIDVGYSFDNKKNFYDWHLSIVNSSPSDGEAGGLGFYTKRYNLSVGEKQQFVTLISLAQVTEKNFYLGINGKYIQVHNEVQEDEQGFNLDVGILMRLHNNISFGVMGYDLGKSNISTNPMKVRMGLGLVFRPNILLSVDVDHFAQEDFRQPDYHTGIEVLPGQKVSFQMGYFNDRLDNSEVVTGGFTFHIPREGRNDYVSYSYSEELRPGFDDDIEKIHSISVGVNL